MYRENEYGTLGTVAQFRKSSYSEGGSTCVEVAKVGGIVLLRNSNYPTGPVVPYTAAEWAAFLKGAKAGEFD